MNDAAVQMAQNKTKCTHGDYIKKMTTCCMRKARRVKKQHNLDEGSTILENNFRFIYLFTF